MSDASVLNCVCHCADEMAFEPREVTITPGRTFRELYSTGEDIGRLVIINNVVSSEQMILRSRQVSQYLM